MLGSCQQTPVFKDTVALVSYGLGMSGFVKVLFLFKTFKIYSKCIVLNLHYDFPNG